MSKLSVDLELVKKYNVAGPRYTSYPPATKFTYSVKGPQLAERILENNRTERDLSIYFHIPFCETLCWYCGCTTVITLNHGQGTTYLNYLEKEVARMSTLINSRRKVVQLHWGGGSPTFQPGRIAGSATYIGILLLARCRAGVEIDPRRLTRDHTPRFKLVSTGPRWGSGFKRKSAGGRTALTASHDQQSWGWFKQVFIGQF
jgi:oxygen-independent coproporphyrinogen-3 oxidase